VFMRASDVAPRVRFQAALTLAAVKDPRAAEVLAMIARRDADEEASRTAVLLGSAGHAGALLAILAGDESFLRRPAGLNLLRRLAEVVGARNQSGEILAAFTALLEPGREGDDARTITVVRSLADGLRLAGNPLPILLPKLAT